MTREQPHPQHCGHECVCIGYSGEDPCVVNEGDKTCKYDTRIHSSAGEPAQACKECVMFSSNPDECFKKIAEIKSDELSRVLKKIELRKQNLLKFYSSQTGAMSEMGKIRCEEIEGILESLSGQDRPNCPECGVVLCKCGKCHTEGCHNQQAVKP